MPKQRVAMLYTSAFSDLSIHYITWSYRKHTGTGVCVWPVYLLLGVVAPPAPDCVLPPPPCVVWDPDCVTCDPEPVVCGTERVGGEWPPPEFCRVVTTPPPGTDELPGIEGTADDTELPPAPGDVWLPAETVVDPAEADDVPPADCTVADDVESGVVTEAGVVVTSGARTGQERKHTGVGPAVHHWQLLSDPQWVWFSLETEWNRYALLSIQQLAFLYAACLGLNLGLIILLKT